MYTVNNKSVKERKQDKKRKHKDNKDEKRKKVKEIELKKSNIIKAFRNNKSNWIEFAKNSDHYFYTPKFVDEFHNFNNHVHIFIPREKEDANKIGYNIKINGKSKKTGFIKENNDNLHQDYKPSEFLKYFKSYEGGNAKPYRKTCKIKTRKRNNNKRNKVNKTKKTIK